jgi:hypothetical protein
LLSVRFISRFPHHPKVNWSTKNTSSHQSPPRQSSPLLCCCRDSLRWIVTGNKHTMKVSLLLALIGAAAAFQQPAIGGTYRAGQHHSALSAVAEPPAAAAPAKLTMASVRRHIDRLNKANFAATLATLEPYLLHEAKVEFYTKCMHRLKRNAKDVGMTVPDMYAHDAACTAKRRAKQDEYIKTKFPPPVADAPAE